jgi:hypothetical protein
MLTEPKEPRALVRPRPPLARSRAGTTPYNSPSSSSTEFVECANEDLHIGMPVEACSRRSTTR